MATTLSRVTTFVPSTPILSSEVNAELNQIVNLLKGTSTSIKAVIKVNDAGDPPLELDQLGAGPLQEWYQTGILKLSVANSGQIVSPLATGTPPLSVASTTVVTNLNADMVDGIQGASFARKDDSSPQVFDGNVVVSANVPEFILIDENHSKHVRFALENTTLFLINETLLQNIWTVNMADNVKTFTAIPVLPGSNPTTANQATRKQYVDDQIATAVLLAGNQTVAGIKTFSSIPVLPASNPTTANQAARKQYVDDAVAAIDLSGIPRHLVSDTTSNSNSGTSETDLTSFTIPAGTLLNNNASYAKFTLRGSQAGSNITLRAYIAGQQIFSLATNNSSNVWGLDVVIVRLTSTTVRCYTTYHGEHINYNDGGAAETDIQQATPVTVSNLDNSTNIFKATGQALVGGNTITQDLLLGEKMN